jgi:hypothetical protein
MNICYDDATIFSYQFSRHNQIYPRVQQIDKWNLMDDPHGDLDKVENTKNATMLIYGTKVQRQYRIQSTFSNKTPGVGFFITNYLQYVIQRNCFERQVSIVFYLYKLTDTEENSHSKFSILHRFRLFH